MISRLRRRILDRILRFGFGRDVFVSYSRSDGLEYAQRLAVVLAQRKELSVYLDQWGSSIGRKLPLRLRLALRRSSAFVLVATPEALRSRYVRRELVKFALTRRTIFAIDVGGSLESAIAEKKTSPLLTHVVRRYEPMTRVTGPSPEPSPEVLDAIDNAARFMRQEQRVSATVGSGMAVVIVALLVAAAISWLVIRGARADAESEIAHANVRVSQADAGARAAEKKRIDATGAATAAEGRAAQAVRREENALRLEQAALKREAVARDSEHEAKANAERQRATTRALQLIGDSQRVMEQQPNQITRAALLAVEGANQLLRLGVRSLQADIALRRVAALLPRVEFVFPVDAGFFGRTAITDDGRFVVISNASNGTVDLIDVPEKRVITLEVGDFEFLDGSVDLSADGSRVLLSWRTNDDQLSIRVVRTDDGTRTLERTEPDWETAVRLSPNGKWLLIWSTESLAVWDTETGKQISTDWTGDCDIADADLSADGKNVVIACGPVYLWNRQTHKTDVLVPTAGQGNYAKVRFIGKGDFVAARSYSQVGIWPVALESQPVWTADFSAVYGPIVKADQVVFFRFGAEAIIYSMRTKREALFPMPCEADVELALTDDEKRAVVLCDDDSMRVYDIRARREVLRLQHWGSENEGVREFATHGDLVTSVTTKQIKRWRLRPVDPVYQIPEDDDTDYVAFSPDSTRVATVRNPSGYMREPDGPGEVMLWTAGEPQPRTIEIEKVAIVAYAPNGQLVAGTAKGEIGIVADDGFHPLPLPIEGSISTIAFAPSGHVFAVGSNANVYVCAGPLESPRILKTLPQQTRLLFLRFLSAEDLLVGSDFPDTRLWRWRTDELPRKIGIGPHVDPIATTRDGRYLAAGERSKNAVSVFDLTTANRAPITLQQDSWTYGVDFDPTEKFLATSSRDAIRVWANWTSESAGEILRLPGFSMNTSFSPDGRWLAHDGRFTIMEWQQERLIAALCAGMERASLTPEEWQEHLPGEVHRSICPASPAPPSTGSR